MGEVRNVVDELATVAAGRRRGGREAPLIMIIALAFAVVKGELETYKRGFAWLVLFSIWAVFRFSDTEWLDLNDDDFDLLIHIAQDQDLRASQEGRDP
jgi:hypothetical protein